MQKSRDVLVDESTFQNWNKKQVEVKKLIEDLVVVASSSQSVTVEKVQLHSAEFDDPTANTLDTKTKLLAEDYERYNLTIIKPTNYEDLMTYKE